jgi:hypothetical protein
MNIALVLQHKLMLALQRFFFSTDNRAKASAQTATRSHALPRRTLTPAPLAARSADRPAGASRHTSGKVMPLRVLHVVERGMPRSSTGRLVISGRMADVCAELDRLVEREAALH